MTNWIIAISTTILMLATVFIAVAAWQAKKGFLEESLYNDSWELYKKWNDLKIWVFSNRTKLDEELITEEKIYSDIFKEKLDIINFLYARVKSFYGEKLGKLELLLTELDSVWLIYATKQRSKEIDKYKSEILQRLANDDLTSRLYNSILNKIK